MEPVSAVVMLWAIALAYLATYGLGAAACRIAKVRPRSAIGRLGVYCGVGTVIVGWVGYGCTMYGAGTCARVFVWASALLGVVLLAWRPERQLATTKPGENTSSRTLLIVIVAIIVALGSQACYQRVHGL